MTWNTSACDRLSTPNCGFWPQPMARGAHGNPGGRARRIVKLVRALRKGWIKADRGAPAEEPPAYLLWQDDGLAADKRPRVRYLPVLAQVYVCRGS